MSPHQIRRDAIKNGYRSGLEHKLSIFLDKLNYLYEYESMKIEWEDLTYRTYTPDFILKNGIIIETKGRFLAADRIIPEDWLKEKGKNKHLKFIKFSGTKVRR